MTNPTVNNLYPVASATTSSRTFVDVFLPRDPTVNDNQYQTQQKWLNTSTGDFFILESFTPTSSMILANWIKVGGMSIIEKLQGNSGGPVPPNVSNIIFTLGDGIGINVVGNPGTNTLTWSLVGGGTALQKVAVDAFTPPGTNPVVPDGTGTMTVTGGQVAAGTTPNVIRTDSLAANTYTIEVQRTQAVASSTIGDNGVAHFNSADFQVDTNGFVSAFNSFHYVQINHASSPYTATGTDFFISCDASAGTITILLPNVPKTFREFIIKDRTGFASVNNISITTPGGVVTIDGQTTYTLAGNFGSIELLFNGTSYEVF